MNRKERSRKRRAKRLTRKSIGIERRLSSILRWATELDSLVNEIASLALRYGDEWHIRFTSSVPCERYPSLETSLIDDVMQAMLSHTPTDIDSDEKCISVLRREQVLSRYELRINPHNPKDLTLVERSEQKDRRMPTLRRLEIIAEGEGHAIMPNGN